MDVPSKLCANIVTEMRMSEMFEMFPKVLVFFVCLFFDTVSTYKINGYNLLYNQCCLHIATNVQRTKTYNDQTNIYIPGFQSICAF